MKRLTRRTGIALATLTAFTLTLAGCAGAAEEAPPAGEPAPAGDADWQQVVEDAKAEGNVTWYSVAPAEVREGLKAGFEAKYPEITLEVIAMGTADMNAALEAEHDTGAEGADVVTSVDYGWILDKSEQGWISELTGPSAEQEEWSDSIIDDQIVNSGLGLMAIAWNTTLFDGEITDYADMLDPSLGDGAIGTARPEPAIHADFWAFVEESHDPDWLENLAAQDPTLYPSAFAVQEALAAGEIAVGGFVSAADMVGLQDKGAPIEFVVPDPALAIGNMFFIPTSGQNQNAAQVFMDYLLSGEGQAIAAQNAYSPLSDVETLSGENEVLLTDVDRVLDKEWFDQYLSDWKKIYE